MIEYGRDGAGVLKRALPTCTDLKVGEDSIDDFGDSGSGESIYLFIWSGSS